MQKNYDSIDIAKFIMAILVMTIHINTGLPASVHDFISNSIARIAVPFFFVSSGFFFFLNSDTISFYRLLKTLKRILLLFWGWTLFYGIYLFFSEYIHSVNPLKKEFAFLFRFLFLDSFAHLWFLPALMVALSLTWFFKKKNMFTIGLFFSIVLYIFGLMGDSYYYLTIQNANLKSLYNLFFQSFSGVRNGIFFGFVFVMFAKFFINQKQKTLFLICFFSLISLIFEYFIIKNNHWAKDYNMYLSLLILSPALFALLLNLNFSIPKKTALFFREYSMGIYFLHIFVKDLNLFDAGSFRFPFIFIQCILIIFIIKKLRIPILTFLLK